MYEKMSVDLSDKIYCAEQINIPVTFPHILKSFAKAAIRTQPYDLLRWTSAYFRALANDEVPPVKERFEHPPFTHPTGLTPRYLKTLLNQLGHTNNGNITNTNNNIALNILLDSWQGIVLSETVLYQILMIGHLLNDDKHYKLDLYRFLAVACGLLSNNLLETMIRVCELFTDEPDGGSEMIPLKTFLNLYEYLAKLNCSSKFIVSETVSSQNVEIASGYSELIESSLSIDENTSLFNRSIPINELRSVCIYDERDESFCELISDESHEYCVTTSDNKTSDDIIKRQNSPSVDEMMMKYDPIQDNKSVKLTVVKEVMRVQDESSDDMDEHFGDDTVGDVVVVAAASAAPAVDKHARMNKNHESPRDLVGSAITLDNSAVVNVTNETPPLEFIMKTIKSHLSLSVTQSQMPSFQVIGSDTVFVRESKSNVRDDEKLEMLNEVGVVKEGKKHTVINTMKKQKYDVNFGQKNISEGTCECHEESWRVKKMGEDETVRVHLPSDVQQSSKKIPSCDKATEFIRKMRVTAPYVNYDVAGIGTVVSNERITKVELWLAECALQQGGHVGPRNLRHFLCPSLYDNNDNDDDNVNDNVNSPRGTQTN